MNRESVCYHMLVAQNPPANAGEPGDDGNSDTPAGQVRLFSYGTLQQRGVQLANFGRKLDGRPDALSGFRLGKLTITDAGVVSVSGSAEHPFAVVTGDPRDEITGTVFTLTSAELAAADRYEVDDYTRVEVLLRSGTRAWVYVDDTRADRATSD